MPVVKTVYADRAGGIHQNAVAAAKGDLKAILGNHAIANLVFQNRSEIETVFAELDAMATKECQ